MSMAAVITILESYTLLFLVLHLLSMAIGLGGATVSDILFFRFLKDYRISQKEVEVLHVLKTVILFTMLLIVLSGVALYVPMAEVLNASPAFLVKVTATAVLLVNGIALHIFVAPHLIHLNLRKQETMGRAWHRLSFALGSISICSWYSVFLIAMTKELLVWNFIPMVTVYFCLLCAAVLVSQLVEASLKTKASHTTD